jgi:hypothetical protein
MRWRLAPALVAVVLVAAAAGCASGDESLGEGDCVSTNEIGASGVIEVQEVKCSVGSAQITQTFGADELETASCPGEQELLRFETEAYCLTPYTDDR